MRGLSGQSRRTVAIVSAIACCGVAATAAYANSTRSERSATYANPVDLPYRYQSWKPAHREAADPTIVVFKGRYWLFASHSKGYWWSVDLRSWNFVPAVGYDADKYAPTAVVMGNRMLLAVGDRTKKIWATDDPASGRWTVAADVPGYDDPCLFLDDDGRLYMYSGLSGSEPLRVAELDPTTLKEIATAVVSASRSKETRGWEVPGDRNERKALASYVEGSWMTKHAGRYYLQYSAPGTEFKTYADGVLVADRPMGPFSYQPYSPFAFKPTGFIAGAGHGSTFRGLDGRWWHAGTMTISKRFKFERRIGLFPAHFTSRGELVADTYLGDYPRHLSGDRSLTGWMLLSRHKPVQASSTLGAFRPENAVDEDVRTWWSAASGDPGEWFSVDLGARKRIDAVQINFADEGSQGVGASGDVYRYVLEASDDGASWRVLADRSRDGREAPHDYVALDRSAEARFVRLRNVHAPDRGRFSLYDLRVFGKGTGPQAGTVRGARGRRDGDDPRLGKIDWMPAAAAEFYVVRLGIRPDLLIQNYQVYDGQTSLEVGSLNAGERYCYAIDAVNETGITRARRATCGL